MTAPEPAISVVPANEASWADLQTVFGAPGPAARCQCQRFKLRRREYFRRVPRRGARRSAPRTDRRGHPESDITSGLVAYRDGEPVGWCAVEPRRHYEGLIRNNRVPWTGRDEDKTDETVWAVTCFFIRRVIARAA